MATSNVDRQGGLAVGLSQGLTDPAWDRFVAGAAGGGHLQTTAWARVKATLGWDATRIAVWSGDELVAGCQVLHKPVSPLARMAYVARGPLPSTMGPEHLRAVVGALDELGTRRRVLYLKVQPPPGGHEMVPALVGRGFVPSAIDVSPTASARIDLDRSEDEVLAAMNTARRRGIRVARRKGVVVRSGGPEDVRTFMPLLEGTAQRQGFPTYSRDYYETMLRSFEPGETAELVLAEHEGTAVAGLLVLGPGESADAKVIGWSGEHPELHANELVYWEAIRWAKSRGYRSFDLGNIKPAVARALIAGEEIKPPGTDYFKLLFGGQPVLHPEVVDAVYPAVLRGALRLAAPRLERLAPTLQRSLRKGRPSAEPRIGRRAPA